MATMMKEERNERREIYSFRRIIKKRKDELNIYIDQSIEKKYSTGQSANVLFHSNEIT